MFVVHISQDRKKQESPASWNASCEFCPDPMPHLFVSSLLRAQQSSSSFSAFALQRALCGRCAGVGPIHPTSVRHFLGSSFPLHCDPNSIGINCLFGPHHWEAEQGLDLQLLANTEASRQVWITDRSLLQLEKDVMAAASFADPPSQYDFEPHKDLQIFCRVFNKL